MHKVKKLITIEGAWHPDLVSHGGTSLVAWRGFDRDKSITEPDVCKLAPIRDETIGDVHEVCRGIFIDGPRLVLSPDGWQLFIEVLQNRGHAIPWYTSLLQAGQHKGVTGGSDHCRPSDRQSAACLTGLWVEDVTEEGIWDALLHRRTFATNGHRMEVRLHTPHGRLGEIVDADGPIHVRWEVKAEAVLQEVMMYRDGHIVQRMDNTDGQSAAGTVIDRPSGSGETSYFIVARSTDGGLLISSPVWIRREN